MFRLPLGIRDALTMMCSRSDVEDDFALIKGRLNHRDVGQMSASEFGVIGNDHVTWLEFATPDLCLHPHTSRHAAEVNW